MSSIFRKGMLIEKISRPGKKATGSAFRLKAQTAVGMSDNTVRKYIRQLEDRELIATELTKVVTRSSGQRNGNLLFTLRPIGGVIDEHYASHLAELELATERQRVAKLLQKQESPS